MVFLSYILRKELSKSVVKRQGTGRAWTFFDTLDLLVRGGAGGQGLPKIGGVGGNGGSVYVVAKKNITLRDVKRKNPTKKYTAGLGSNSWKRGPLGPPGKDIEIPVPVGVEVKDQYGRVLGSLDIEGDKVLVAQGGEGGNPANNFQGFKGQKRFINLDLKLLADVGLVGFPNAGKSTLLSAVSRAGPKIASYPFTTVKPQLAKMEYEDFRQISIADLPGLIEGAHLNRGMGHTFLKHIERTKMLLFMVDVGGFQLSPKYPYRSALETILLLNRELELYKEELLEKPCVLALNKIDKKNANFLATDVKEQLQDMEDSVRNLNLDKDLLPQRFIRFDEVFTISAKLDIGVEELKHKLRDLLDTYADQRTEYQRQRFDHQRELDSKTSVEQAGFIV
ncbi:GTP-binding protein 10 isoform X2 [Lingula anatina]|uniref:GTP-binding protein 10 isoform X1 n=1 Tax=Lingula anatina TaxID=7574 RepID=A0A1S3IC72_LINAN|nr:GTP-binding protein 10 isoform X1 [Lingula anatina]XP_013395024.1 GTP-binding protein 10 isoform X2 [Lingula anatina]|eukprot:XP_013395023.1 GTP-binding protein 10 isoform X1 [Lingula anatina]